MKRRIALGIVVIGALVVAGVVPAGGASTTGGSDQIADRVSELRQALAGHHGTHGGGGGPAFAMRGSHKSNLSLVGMHDLGAGGFNSDVWSLRKHAYVGTWGLWTPTGVLCPATGTRIVDISDPANPVHVATMPTEDLTQTNDVKVARVSTPFFGGDLAVVSNEDCAPGGARGFELWDVTDPTDPMPLGRYGPDEAFDEEPFLTDIGFGVHNNFIYEMGNRVFVFSVVDFAELFQLDLDGLATVGDLRIVEVTDPTAPVEVADWGAIKDLGLDPVETGQGDDLALSFLHDVWVENGVAYLSWWDAGLILLDVSDPTNPQFLGRAANDPDEEGNTHVAVPARGGNLVVTGDEDFTADPWGFMRVYNSRDETDPFQISTFGTPNSLSDSTAGDFSIHNVIVRGNTVYASWYSDGIRLIDISKPKRPRETASFVPPAVADPFGVLPTVPEVWGVYVEGKLILASDMNAGLYILRRKP